MGATKGNIDQTKFASELQEVIQRILSLQPSMIIETDLRGQTITDARLSIDERETTRIVLQIVEVAERNGLKLPREFGLILKQTLYFDRYQKLLAPDMDPLKDVEIRNRLAEELRKNSRPINNNDNIIQSTTITSSSSKYSNKIIIDVTPTDDKPKKK
jgi:predicted unusual protein kinase regulating ubiquinone biosynthesis (AarF/ABC1/UbiB family)